MVRKVDISGKLRMKALSPKAGNMYGGKRVGLKEMQNVGCYEMWRYSTKVGMIDLEKQPITNSKRC